MGLFISNITDIILSTLFLIPGILTSLWALAWSFAGTITLPAKFLIVIHSSMQVLRLIDFACPVSTPCSVQYGTFVLKLLGIITAIIIANLGIKIANAIRGGGIRSNAAPIAPGQGAFSIDGDTVSVNKF